MKKWSYPFILFLALLIIFPTTLTTDSQTDDEAVGFLHNPLNAFGGADPWLVYYEGYYYLSTTTWRSELLMTKSPTLAGLKTAVPVQIYVETDPSRCCNMWAPEFYLLDGPNGPRWYFYYSAGTSGTHDNQRTHVLESEGTDPLGPYTYKGRIYDPYNDGWAIDGSILELNDSLYFLFSSWVGPNQSLFIAPISNPWTISGPRVMISQPEYDWERHSANVNEAPVALYRDDDVFIIYSASFCASPEYKLGMLSYNGGDPLRASSWEKHPEPVFQRAILPGLEAGALAQPVPETQIVRWRHGGEHRPGLGQLLLHPRDARQHLHRGAGFIAAQMRDGRLQLVQAQLQPQLAGLMDDDEHHLVMLGGEGFLRPQNCIQRQIAPVGQACFRRPVNVLAVKIDRGGKMLAHRVLPPMPSVRSTCVGAGRQPSRLPIRQCEAGRRHTVWLSAGGKHV